MTTMTTTLPFSPRPWFEQNYNTGRGAPLPFATECTVDEGTCDPGVLMQWLDNPDSAEGIDLELAQTAEPGDAVGEVVSPPLGTPPEMAHTCYKNRTRLPPPLVYLSIVCLPHPSLLSSLLPFLLCIPSACGELCYSASRDS